MIKPVRSAPVGVCIRGRIILRAYYDDGGDQPKKLEYELTPSSALNLIRELVTALMAR